MEIVSRVLGFLQSNWEWLFGSGGVLGVLVVLIKIFISKPAVQQSQSVHGCGEAYQAGQDLTVTKKESAK